jgi:hypothetical protein
MAIADSKASIEVSELDPDSYPGLLDVLMALPLAR